MKFFASHSSILNSLGDELKKGEQALHLTEVAKRLEGLGAKITEITRFNVVAELPEHRIKDLFDFGEHELEEFIGEVKGKLHAIREFIDHLEICHEHHGHQGS